MKLDDNPCTITGASIRGRNHTQESSRSIYSSQPGETINNSIKHEEYFLYFIFLLKQTSLFIFHAHRC